MSSIKRHESHPGELHIGNIILPCAVLDDATRVLSTRGIYSAFTGKKAKGGRVSEGGQKVPRFMGEKHLIGLISQDLMAAVLTPIEYMPKHGGRSAYGYEATILPSICEVIIDANKIKELKNPSMALVAETLLRGFARVGIIALVDEATGYQESREKQALAAILDAFLRKEFAAWAKRFPDEFYKEIYRLKGWPYNPQAGGKRPHIIARYTNDIVYQRLAPGVLEELQRLNPKDEKGRRKHKHFQWLTDDVGHPALTQHIYTLMAFMRASTTWDRFYRSVQRALPKKNEAIQLLLIDIDE